MSKPSYRIDPAEIDGVIFDLDGVITQTATVHAAAWKATFDAVLEDLATAESAQAPFDLDADYREYVDGKPRYEGVQSFLLSRGIDLPWGDPEDPPDAVTVCGVGNLKNRRFLDLLAERGAEVYPSSVALLRELRARGLRTAVVTSSRNCETILEGAGIAGLFDARVDGNDAARRGLKGKPEPDTFVAAARDLGLSPGRAIVVEDAISGVQAGRAGGFAHVIGVDRSGHPEALRAGGADWVVTDLDQVTVAEGAG